MSDPIQISETDHLIASGAYCRCYEHPENPDLCLKITTDNPKSVKRFKADLAYFRTLHRIQTDLSMIADYVAPCTTNLGPAHLFECVRDHDGTVSNTLEHYLKTQPEHLDAFFHALQDLGQYLQKNQILVSDLHGRNILLQRSADHALTPIVIDGLGERVAIPILNLFDSLVDAKIVRRWNRFLDKLQEAHPSLSLPLERAYLSKKK